MTKSKYATNTILSPNYYANRGGRKVTRITPHHMAGNLSADSCANLFANPSRQASCNYCIGTDGKVTMSVPEEHAAWTSSSYDNDTQAITFEIANDGKANWHVSDKALNKFIDMCVDICKRYKIKKLVKGQNLTWHSMFAATNCPGPYLMSKLDYVCKTVNSKLVDKPKQPKSEPKNDKGLRYRSHCQTAGNMPMVRDGQISGTVGDSKRLEDIRFESIPEGYTIEARAHIQTRGWTNWKVMKTNFWVANNIGKSKRLEAIQLRAKKDGKAVNINYQAHVQKIGWQKIMKNGAIAGSTGKALRLEALKVWL